VDGRIPLAIPLNTEEQQKLHRPRQFAF